MPRKKPANPAAAPFPFRRLARNMVAVLAGRQQAPHMAFGRQRLLPGKDGFVLPDPAQVPKAVMRGEVDAAALALGGHDIKVHETYRPQGRMAADAFDRLERVRIEALGLDRHAEMAGLRQNLDAAFLARQTGWRRYLSRNHEVEQLARNALVGGEPFVAFPGHFGAWLQEKQNRKYRQNFRQLSLSLFDQHAYARAALRLLHEQGYRVDAEMMGPPPDYKVELDFTEESNNRTLRTIGRLLSRTRSGGAANMLVTGAFHVMDVLHRLGMSVLEPFLDVRSFLVEISLKLPLADRKDREMLKRPAPDADGRMLPLGKPAKTGRGFDRLLGGRMPKRTILPPAASDARNPLQRRIEDRAYKRATYKVATRDNDSERPLADWVGPHHPGYSPVHAAIREAVAGDRRTVMQLAGSLSAVAQGRPQTDISFGAAEDGVRLHPNRLASFVANPGVADIYTDEQPRPLVPELAVTILAGMSPVFAWRDPASRREEEKDLPPDPHYFFVRTVHALSAAFMRLNVPVEILTQAVERLGFEKRVQGLRYVTLSNDSDEHPLLAPLPKKFAGRYAPVHRIICKQFREARCDVADRLARLSLLDGMSGNIGGEALLWAHGRLLQQPARRRLLVVVGKALPGGHYYRIRAGTDEFAAGHVTNAGPFGRHLREAVTAISEHSSVGVVHVSPGHYWHGEMGPYYYPHTLEMHSRNELGAFSRQFAATVTDLMQDRRRPAEFYKPFPFRAEHGILFHDIGDGYSKVIGPL